MQLFTLNMLNYFIVKYVDLNYPYSFMPVLLENMLSDLVHEKLDAVRGFNGDIYIIKHQYWNLRTQTFTHVWHYG